MITVRTNDPARVPAHWTEIIRPGQFAVFVVDAHTQVARDADGSHFPASDRSTVTICDHRSEAKAFAEALVSRFPALCCQIYDHEGKSNDPVEVVYHHSVRHKYAGPRYHKREILWGVLAMLAGIVFIVIDFRHDLLWMWGYVVGVKLCLIGGSFLIRGISGLHEDRAAQTPAH